VGWPNFVLKPVFLRQPRLKVVQHFFFSRLKAFLQLPLSDVLKTAKVKVYDENNLQESAPLNYKFKFKINANSKLALNKRALGSYILRLSIALSPEGFGGMLSWFAL